MLHTSVLMRINSNETITIEIPYVKCLKHQKSHFLGDLIVHWHTLHLYIYLVNYQLPLHKTVGRTCLHQTLGRLWNFKELLAHDHTRSQVYSRTKKPSQSIRPRRLPVFSTAMLPVLLKQISHHPSSQATSLQQTAFSSASLSQPPRTSPTMRQP